MWIWVSTAVRIRIKTAYRSGLDKLSGATQ